MEQVIAINDVYKSFDKKPVLQGIQLGINKGDIYGLIGPSGAGKSTLIKVMVGMETPDAGEVRVFDEKIPNLKVLHDIGYMAQSDALYGELTGKENLQFFASLYRLKKEERNARIEYVARLVNITADLNKRVSAYSGGMKRRLSLAIALLHDPKLLILDEPTVGIDPELRLEIWQELFRLRDEGKTIIVTTHVMVEAERCDRIALIREGKIIAAETPEQLTNQYGAENLDQVFLKAGRGE